jgi:hypothetical protein
VKNSNTPSTPGLPRGSRLHELSRPALVVVGAAHLPGADGLLALLKAQGFEASPVSAVAGTPAGSPE